MTLAPVSMIQGVAAGRRRWCPVDQRHLAGTDLARAGDGVIHVGQGRRRRSEP